MVSSKCPRREPKVSTQHDSEVHVPGDGGYSRRLQYCAPKGVGERRQGWPGSRTAPIDTPEAPEALDLNEPYIRPTEGVSQVLLTGLNMGYIKF